MEPVDKKCRRQTEDELVTNAPSCKYPLTEKRGGLFLNFRRCSLLCDEMEFHQEILLRMPRCFFRDSFSGCEFGFASRRGIAICTRTRVVIDGDYCIGRSDDTSEDRFWRSLGYYTRKFDCRRYQLGGIQFVSHQFELWTSFSIK